MISRSHHQMASQGTVYDMAVDPKTDVVITVGQVCMLHCIGSCNDSTQSLHVMADRCLTSRLSINLIA